MSRSAPSAAAAVLFGGLFACLAATCSPPIIDAPRDAIAPSVSGDRGGGSSTPAAIQDDTGWETIGTGVERRRLAVRDDARLLIERLLIVRLDPALVRFDVAYSPGAPRTLAAWQADSGALLVVNGGFFTETYDATGLVVSDGVPHGVSYDAFAGMFAVTEAGPEVRWLGERPYDPAEPLLAALQAFPMLVRPGGVAGVVEPDASAARRTWIGQDGQGRVLVGVAPSGGLTLAALSAWLTASDLDLDRALNLDGGGSTGLVLVAADGASESVPAFDVLPTVILAYPR